MADNFKNCPNCNGLGKILNPLQFEKVEIYYQWRTRYRAEWKPLYDQIFFYLPDKKCEIIKQMKAIISSGSSIPQQLFEELEFNLKTTVDLEIKYEAIRSKGKAEDKAHWDAVRNS